MRLTDHIEKNVTLDFMSRSHSLPMKQLGGAYLFALVLVASTSYFAPYIGGTSTVSILTILAVIVLGIYTLIRSQQHNDQMLATEFENLLFASAAGLDSAFCLFPCTHYHRISNN